MEADGPAGGGEGGRAGEGNLLGEEDDRGQRKCRCQAAKDRRREGERERRRERVREREKHGCDSSHIEQRLLVPDRGTRSSSWHRQLPLPLLLLDPSSHSLPAACVSTPPYLGFKYIFARLCLSVTCFHLAQSQAKDSPDTSEPCPSLLWAMVESRHHLHEREASVIASATIKHSIGD